MIEVSMLARCSFRKVALVATALSLSSALLAQTAPQEGIRKNTPTVHAFINARLVRAPGQVLDGATLVIRNGVVEAAGTVKVPADARVWNLQGMTIYPGFVNSSSEYGLPKPQTPPRDGGTPGLQEQQRGPTGWTGAIQSHVSAAELFAPDPKAAEQLRSQGFTATLVVPTRGNLRGTSALVSLGEGKARELVLRPEVAQHFSLDVDYTRGTYPSSLMGVIALIRQTLYDAQWYQKALEAYRKDPSLPRPETNASLAALKSVVSGTMPVILDGSDELDELRGEAIAKEFNLKLILRGSGTEYRRLEATKALHRSFILPVNFPEPPKVQTPEEALQVSLADLLHWDAAPENPKRLQEAGVSFALTSASLKNPSQFLAQVRKAVERGLNRDAALAALTTTPATLFGADQQIGTLDPGKIANFIIANGDLFAGKTVIREVWVDGKRFPVKPLAETDPRGVWTVKLPGITDTVTLTLKGETDALQGNLHVKRDIKPSTVVLAGLQLSLNFPGDSLGHAGLVRVTANIEPTSMTGTGEWPTGETFDWSAARTGAYVPEPDTAKPKPPTMASFPPAYPPGEFGRPALPEQPAVLMVRNATIWTCGPQGILEKGDIIVRKGKVAEVGANLKVPSGAQVIDAAGKHVTPGIIDAHSHMAGAGNLNEAARAISAEVRIGDVIDCDDINLYRNLAGGLTIAHVLHGSANPIGGQNQVIKLRWGALPEEMKFDAAPPTIKFALGENVKQSNWGEGYSSRYPQTRMGVEQIMRDEFRAALDYERARATYDKTHKGIPPRRDLELDAILQIIHGTMFVHCHAYRQDEVVSTMRIAEDFGFRIRAFQHILEGYKVADVMAKHGAGGSSFSDWWAYKFEVYDAIPYNGALMHDQGVLVSYNSDSDELSRRLPLEAAKAVKYGGLSYEEALKFVTINPAKQLFIDKRVGSVEVGKDADFAIWSGSPLSTLSLCEQTWIDGRRYFDRREDRKLYEEAQHERAVLIQKVLTAKPSPGGGAPGSPGPMSEPGGTLGEASTGEVQP
jgi:imidazolonepropionase-like amidohydrolase